MDSPLYNKIIITRDVYFNKEKVFNGNIKIFTYKVKNMSLKYLVKIIKKVIQIVKPIVLPTTYNNTAEDLEWFYKSKGNKKNFDP